ncbi:FAD-dependent oxidoreductase [Rhodococcoides fascians]|uniref:FAD-dependent oxidoreductase n=1 Tax=Rhodococcoides fascians TaxID=1828 RepID=UPI00050CC252|nr:FAD-dependent oxidoreductase [Rhodococcus fascians]AMY51800.1 Cytochrome b6-f complex iron-sulfur subunit 1 [Rhodococcus fascians D188]
MPPNSLWLDRPDRLPYRAIDFTQKYDTVVIGAGLTGLVTALLFARAGERVAVLEARTIGAVATGNTTAKISVLQGTKLSSIASKHSHQQVRRYVQGNTAGQQWLLEYCAERGIAVQRETAYTYATTSSGLTAVRDELRVALGAGLNASYGTDTELPFDVAGAVSVPDQAQFDPMDALIALAEDASSAGADITEGTRALGVRRRLRHVDVKTDQGPLRGSRVVLATGTPILDRGAFFARMEPMRSYAAAYEIDGDVPRGMYLSADSPSRSIRYAPTPAGDLLLIGGNDHVVGRESSPQAQVNDLDEWTAENFPGARRRYRWSAQDYGSIDALPYAGPLLPGDDRIWVATGYDKWGMTNAAASALVLAQRAFGGRTDWAGAYDSWNLRQLTGIVDAIRINANVGLNMTKGWAKPITGGTKTPPVEGQGHVEPGIAPKAVCTVDGVTHRVSAVCPHLGGIVAWNDAEKSWDCPLHGSRFAADGSVLEGPVTSGLNPLS